MERKRLGDVLVEAGVITSQELELGLARQAETRRRLGETLVELGVIDEDRLAWCLAEVMGVPLLNLSQVFIDPKVSRLLAKERCEILRLLPLSILDEVLTVAMSDPFDVVAFDEVRMVTGMPVRAAVASESSILKTIHRCHSEEVGLDEVVSRILPTGGIELAQNDGDIDTPGDLTRPQGGDEEWRREGTSPPVVRLVNSIILDAIKLRASDIHIEPMETTSLVRYRVDGMLRTVVSLPIFLHPRTVCRIKILGRMDIAERRIPQDGGCRVRARGNEMDLRLSTMPTRFGEKVVIRLLSRQESQLRLESMGLLPDNLARLERMLRMPQGILLLTGPTGSGKTTTLYSMLHRLKAEGTRNIVTLEDPIEYNVPGVIQTQVHEKAGLTFASGFRAILRQDPDVIMVGEIRDAETAEIAFNAAVTGHLVLSTLHTNDSASVPIRLRELGVSPFVVSTGLKGVISQRLVRRLCVHCREGYEPDEAACRALGLSPGEPVTLYRAAGCKRCSGTGYHGRIGIYEFLVPSDKVREMIFEGASASAIAEQALREGNRDLSDEGALRVVQGLTSMDEVMRVAPIEERRGLCPQCRKPVERHYATCPYCAFPLSKDLCRTCGRQLEEGWRACPYCCSAAAAPPTPAPAVEPAPPPEAERCTSCGMILKPSWTDCPLCLKPRGSDPKPAEAAVREEEPLLGTLLLVVDDPDLLVEVRRAAQAAGFGVLQSGSAEEALRRLKDTAPMGLVVEAWLPDMDGFDLCRQVRDLPVAMVLAPEIQDEARDAREAGAAAILTTPVSAEALRAAFGGRPLSTGRTP